MKYTEIIMALGDKVITRDNEDGSITYIPIDPANSDYQAYLNKDKAEQSTPIVTGDVNAD
jgi:hypothetical protein